MIYIGIDVGVDTGLAVWDSEAWKFLSIETTKIHRAMEVVKMMVQGQEKVRVRFEDARKRNWFGNSGKEKWQGAGSIKRDSKIWEDFLKDIGADFQMIAPRDNVTKLEAPQFAAITKWKGRTSEHGRDAAMLVFGTGTQRIKKQASR